jgi:hypothetical protein
MIQKLPKPVLSNMISIVDTVPTIPGNNLGELVYVKLTNDYYFWNGTTWNSLAAGSYSNSAYNILGYSNEISLTSLGNTLLYTTPADGNYVIVRIFIYFASITGLVGLPSGVFGSNAPNYDNWQPGIAPYSIGGAGITSGMMESRFTIPFRTSIYGPSSNFYLRITTAATAATYRCRFIMCGFKLPF